MITLVITICQISSANVCKDIFRSYDEALTPYQCSAKAQQVMPEILAAYPQWKVARWGCKPAQNTDA